MRRSTASATLACRTSRVIAFGILGLALVVSACGDSELRATPQLAATAEVTACFDASGAPPLESISEDEPDLTPQLKEARSQLESSIPAEMRDVSTLVSRLGGDPAGIAEFVQTRIALEPYAGVLRGPMGTLWSGGGSVVDRTTLAAELLKAAGHEVRFAFATLSTDVAGRLLQRALERQQPSEVALELFRPLLEQATRHFLVIEHAVSETGVDIPQTRQAEWERARESVGDHVWVQFRQGSEWVDLDPSPGVEFGRSLVPVERTAPELDPQLFHSFELMYEVEIESHGEHTRRNVLHYRVPTATIPALPIGLYHVSEEGSAVPRLVLGSRVYEGASFPASVDAGSAENPFASLGVAVQKAMEGGAAALTDDQGEAASDRDSARTIAARLHLCSDGPEGTRRVTHTVFDETAGSAEPRPATSPAYPTARAGLSALLGISVVTGPPSLGTVSRAVLATGDPQTFSGAAGRLALMGFDYQLVRELVPTSFLKPLPRRYLNGPTIAVVRAETDGGGQSRLTYDLASKAYRLGLGTEESPEEQSLFYDYLFNGVLDHSVERLVAGESGGIGSLVESAVADGIAPAHAVTHRDAASDLPGDLSELGVQRATAALQDGTALVLPSRRPGDWTYPLAWWEVDPASGWTEDLDELGRHRAGSSASPQAVGMEYGCMVKQGKAKAFAVGQTVGLALLDSSYWLGLSIFGALASGSATTLDQPGVIDPAMLAGRGALAVLLPGQDFYRKGESPAAADFSEHINRLKGQLDLVGKGAGGGGCAADQVAKDLRRPFVPPGFEEAKDAWEEWTGFVGDIETIVGTVRPFVGTGS